MSDTPLILHIGLHRCGSTSIQKALAKARPLLAASGWRVVLRDELHSDKGWAPLRRLHHRPMPVFDHIARARLIRAIEGSAEGVVVSYENLLGTMPGAQADDFYPDLDRFAAALARLQAQTSRRLEVRLVTRPADSWWESVHMFRAIRGYQGSLADFTAPYPVPLPDPAIIGPRLLQAGVQHFQQIDLASLMARGGEGLAQFLGLPLTPALATALTPERANARMSPEALVRWQALAAAGGIPKNPQERDALLYQYRSGQA